MTAAPENSTQHDTSATPSSATPPTPRGIDPRGPRFGAAITAVLLLAVILLGDSVAALVIAGIVVAGFALGAFGGIQRTWQGAVYRTLVAPRLAPPTEREDPRPPTFAQLVGFIIVGTGFTLELLGVPNALLIGAILGFIAAFLNAVFNFCLGCELYGLLVRLRPNRATGNA